MTNKKIIYQIRHKETGLFSLGGVDCCADPENRRFWKHKSWSKEGKIWTSAGALRRHLQQYENQYLRTNKAVISIPEEWEVIEIICDFESKKCEIKMYNAKHFYDKCHKEQ